MNNEYLIHECLMQRRICYNKTDVNLHTFYAALISRELLSRVRRRYRFVLVTQVYSESAYLLACRLEFRHAGGTEALTNIIIIFNYTSSAMSLHFEATMKRRIIVSGY